MNKKEKKQNTEEQILKFWKKEKIFEKLRKKNSKGKKFYMMDGPPYATGHIHMGTALNKILKDIAIRSRRIQGFDVFDRPGYDTHGVPIEFQIEKEIGSKNKQDIEKYGVKKFIDKCKDFATRYIDVMNSEFLNLGVWMDFNSPYLTLSDSYIETIWDTFKEADKKNLLYLGKYPVHVCPRCETAVAYNEIEYSKQEDTSVFVKFPLKDKKNSFLIIWTTTSWTLPANTGVMAHPDFEYQEIELSNGERWVIAKELVEKIMSRLELGYNVKKTFLGKEMKAWKYENPLSKHLKMNLKNAYRVVLSGRYVNLEDGTGLVHCAPGHGKEDYGVGKENNLDMPSPVEMNGNLTQEAGKYSGKKARVVDKEIIEDLEREGYLIYKMKYEHDYPLCWRCKTPLLMIAVPQWFLRISEIQNKILKENDGTKWVPSWVKLRAKAWLEGLGDWPISRMRYWGTPLPIWVCEKCGKRKVIGSIQELEKLSGKKKIALHKPEIDEVEIKCECRGKMKRVPEVLDVWFDSGVSSWAALNYMKEKGKFKKFWPADLNIEGKDQIRGWWNSQFILSQIKFGKKPFKSIAMHGMVLDMGKKKMSKSKGNVISPHDIIKNYSRDYLRYYFAKLSRGDDFAFDEKEFEEIKKAFIILVNINNFASQLEKGKLCLKIEDKWILSKFNSLVKEARESFNTYRFYEAVLRLEEFLVKDFSRTYVQIIRERQEEAYETINEVRTGLLKLLSPIIPFITEKIWQELREKNIVKEESVHLASWPEFDKKKIDKNLEEEMRKAFEIIEAGLRERDKARIGLKWPLGNAFVYSKEKLGKEFEEIILRQLNLKKLEFKKGELKVELDTKMTRELEAEGYSRELARKIQSERKKTGLKKSQFINLKISCDEKTRKMFQYNLEFLKERTNSSSIEFVDKKLKIEFETEKIKYFQGDKKPVVFYIKEKKIGIEFSTC